MFSCSSLYSKLVVSTISFTPETGITNDLFIRKSGNVVIINGYLTGTSALTSNQLLGTIASGSRPVAPVRVVAEVSEAAYAVGDIAYINIGTNGEIRVSAKSGNTYKTVYFSASFMAT